MTEDWKTLRAGDWIRIVRLPTRWSPPGWNVPAETRALWQALIDSGRLLQVTEIGPDGLPWIDLKLEREGRVTLHSIAVDDDSWVLVPDPG